jgi:hypothetical protein
VLISVTIDIRVFKMNFQLHCYCIVFLFTLCLSVNVYIHIGPHKTGSTHVQKFVVTHLKEMKQAGFCFPSTKPIQNKSMSRLTLALHTSGNITLLRQVINDCLEGKDNQPKENIFMTAENIAALSPTQLEILKSLFPTNSTITIMLAYREWLNRVYSQYTQETKGNIFLAAPFSSFLFDDYGHLTYYQSFNVMILIKKFEKAFGSNNIRLLDYNGIAAEGKDIVHGYFCEIINILCSSTSRLNIDKSLVTYENVKPYGHLIHLISLIRDYIFSQEYTFITSLKIPTFTKKLVANYTIDPFLSYLPTKKSKALLLHPYATQIDTQFRTEYGLKMLYSNATASMEAMKTVEPLEIDIKKFFRNAIWIKWLADEFQRFKNLKVIVKSSKKSSEEVVQ